ncbi:uncharacterized protein LOC144093361 isoform X2 [Stigmatopora argus]
MQREQLVKRAWEPEADLWTCTAKKRARVEAQLPNGGPPPAADTLPPAGQQAKTHVAWGGPASLATATATERPRAPASTFAQVALFSAEAPPLSCRRCLAGEVTSTTWRSPHAAKRPGCPREVPPPSSPFGGNPSHNRIAATGSRRSEGTHPTTGPPVRGHGVRVRLGPVTIDFGSSVGATLK